MREHATASPIAHTHHATGCRWRGSGLRTGRGVDTGQPWVRRRCVRYAAAAPTTPTRPIPVKRVVGEPETGVDEVARSCEPALGLTSPGVLASGVIAPGAVAAVGPDELAVLRGAVVVAPDDGIALSANGFAGVPLFTAGVVPLAEVVPRGLLDGVPRGLLDELALGFVEDVERGVLDALGVRLALGFGVEDALGFGALAAAGGAVSGLAPDPNANPRTVPGAGS